MSQVAQLAGVSVNRAVSVLNELVHLGMVERREAGSAALVRLDWENEVAKLIIALQGIRARVVAELRSTAKRIVPLPASLVLFGSFVRGEATADSDLDVLVVRPKAVGLEDVGWADSLGSWAENATHIGGNPVNLVVVGEAEIPTLLKRRSSLWGDIAAQGIVLAGASLADLAVA
jgi:predicted nucleotidyltransferase